jgi:hypothetical protein
MIDVILHNLGGDSGIVTIVPSRGHVELRETGGLNRQLAALRHAETIAQVLAGADQIITNSEALSRQVYID